MGILAISTRLVGSVSAVWMAVDEPVVVRRLDVWLACVED